MSLSKEFITQLRKEEVRLKRRHGIRVVVQKLTANGVNLMCVAWRTGILQRSMDEHEIVSLAHEALRSLNRLGFRSFVSVVNKRTMEPVPQLVKTDPFLLLSAMQAAGVTEKGTDPAISSEEMQRRIALMRSGKLVK